MGVLRQCFFAFIACYVCLCLGLMFAWPSSTVKLFQSTNTTLHRPMTETELGLFGSLSSVGAVICTPIAGYLMDVIGRKNCTIFSCLAQVIAWTLVIVSNRVEVILASIFISGAGGTSFLVVSVYVGEFSQESIRGALTSLSLVFYVFGMLVSYLLGGYLKYMTMNYVCLTMAIAGVVMISLLKDSPVFLMKKGREEEAVRAISFFRGASRDSTEMRHELDNIRRALNPDVDDAGENAEEENLNSHPEEVEKTPKNNLSKWEFIKRSYSTRRAIFVITVLFSLCLGQGLIVLQVYAEPLFEIAVPNMSPTIASVLLATVGVVAGFIAAYLVDTIGRRKLMVWSSVAAGLSIAVVGSQLQWHWAPHWVTAVAVYAFAGNSAAGAGTVPYVLLAETFLPEVRSLLSMMLVEWGWINNFIILFLFHPLVKLLGLAAVFYIFSIVCFMSALFPYYLLPETMGLPVHAIQVKFSRKNQFKTKL